MASKNIVEIVIKATDKASKEMGKLDGVMKKLGAAAGVAGVAVAAMGVAAGVAIIKMTKEAAQVEKLKNTFDSLADSINENADLMIKDLRVASRGMLNDADLMQASNKLVAMGLADTSEESAKLVEMSTQLGSAMGMTATDSAEAFALMLANQSIPRLDNFGISSGVVRDRILELMEANAGMTRETAFMTATMEEGAKTMEKVGEQGTGAAASMARLQANVDNLKVRLGTAFLPMLEAVTKQLLIMWDKPEIQNAIFTLINWIENIVGDESSGLVGLITKLASGDIERAFAFTFGENSGTYKTIMFFIHAIEGIEFAIDKLKGALDSFRENAHYNFTQAGAYATAVSMGKNTAPRGYAPPSSGTSAATRMAMGMGWASGGSFIVPGSGSGDRPYTMGLEPGEGVTVTPRGQMGGSPITVHLHMNSAVSLADRSEAERVLLPFIEKGLRTVMAR